jgi:hypothetical protein
MISALKYLGLLVFASGLVREMSGAVLPLVNHGDVWRYHKGSTAPQSNWKMASDGSLDGSWLSGPGGFGYGDGDDTTVLSDMQGASGYTTLYIRREFQLASAVDAAMHVRLTIDWDDAYVVYLDGAEISRSSLVPGSAGTEPPNTATATATHEASGSGGPPVSVLDLGTVGSRLGVGPHVLAVLGLNESLGSSDFSLIVDLAAVDMVSTGNITVDTTWTAAASPYVISNNITVVAGVTLTIEPGVTLLFDQGRSMTINGRLLAEGAAGAPITFTRNVGATTWTQLAFTANNTTSRIAHADMSFFSASAIEATGTALHLDSIRWTNSTVQVVDLHDSSIVLLNSFIPGGAGNEPVHFSGMPANGHALIKGCVFGAPRGYNDSIDFTGGNRPGPIAQFIDNVFLAAVDDCFDMDATDAHIEGNIFMNVMQDGQRDSSSNPITTGEGNGVSELYICRNIFFNCEHTLLLKDNGAAVMQNNTIIHLITNAIARNASGDPIPPGIILFGEPWRGRPYGAGAFFEGNIAYDLDAVIQATPFPLYDPSRSFLDATHNLIQGGIWPGEGNITGNPLFVNVNGPMTPATIRSNLMLMAGSPCIRTGPNDLDMGALVPAGASISGIPSSPSSETSLSVRVAGPGVVAYRWSLNNGPWSPEIPLTTSHVITSNLFNSTNGLVQLSGLANGTNTFRAIGKNSASFWQETNAATAKTWVVETTPPLRIAFDGFSGGVVTLSFVAQAGQTYSLLYKDSLNDSAWQRLKNIPSQQSTGTVQVTDDAPSASTRFYQLVTPMQP